MQTLKQVLKKRKMFKDFTLFYDIETFQYNESEGKKFPSRYKNMIFAVGVSWLEGGQVGYEVFPSFKEIFDLIIEVYSPLKNKPKIFFNAHNGNKYDNHFLRKELLYHYQPMKVENYWLQTATTEKSNENTLRINQLTKEDKQGIILEKRIKSSINLEMIIFLKGVQIETVDNWVKTNSSIAMLGKKLKRLGYVSDAELKTDFDYTKHNLEKDLTDAEAKEYAYEIFSNLTDDEITYIQNDVILLAKSAYYYSELFNGFDYSKMTFTSNILESYNVNDLTSFQLLNRIGQGKDKHEIRYTDYKFSNQNFYDYLKPFYRGGLNFYNQNKIGKIITSGVFGIDINSSYPYAMHNFKIPTYIKDYEEYKTETLQEIVYNNDDYFGIYQLTKTTFDNLILDKIDSVIFKQMLVKYYSTNDYININSYTFKMLSDILNIDIKEIPVLSYVLFETKYFGSREQIEYFYKIKTEGAYDTEIIFKDPYNIEVTDKPSASRVSPEEYDNSKVNLNGLYGIPALRPYFNLFRRTETGEYINIENGHKNAERNIVFSIFVTSVSLWNLLSPFKYLTQDEIDEHFIYADTDSLYMEKEIQHKIPEEIFSDTTLGKWDIDYNNIENFYVLNHKKYAFIDDNGKIKVRAGGVRSDSFNTDMNFEEFIETQFSHGTKINTLKSIYNLQETISIYPSVTNLELGSGYRIISAGDYYDKIKEQIFAEVRENIDEFTSDILYIESEIGTFSIADVYQEYHETKNKRSLVYLEMKQEQIKNLINE